MKRSVIPNFVSRHAKWLFPLAVIGCLLLATIFRISGSSFGPYYDEILMGQPTSNLIAGEARGIRSDEWLVITQFLIAQERAGYPIVNTNIGGGTNMSLITDTPYREWSVLFRPQNLSFFIMPFEHAFAFKWWSLLAVLLISIYFLALYFLPRKYIYATLIAIIGGVTPFIFWWYQSITLLSISFGIIALLIVLRIIENRPLALMRSHKHRLAISQLILATALAYILTAFILLLYPAFQIPIVLVVALVALGEFMKRRASLPRKERRRLYVACLYVAGSAAFSLGIFALFIFTRLDAVKALTQTVYPGARVVASGEPSTVTLLGMLGHYQFRLLDNSTPYAPGGNQSEQSAFIVLPFVLVIPVAYVVYTRWIRERYRDWLGIMIITANLLFLAHLFVPGFSIIMKPLGLSLVPLARLQIGLGLLGILSLLYLLSRHQSTFKQTRKFMGGYAFGLLMAYLVTAVVIFIINRRIAGDPRLLLGAALMLGAGLGCLLYGKIRTGLTVLALLSIAFTITIQPLYIGFGAGFNANPITAKIQSLSNSTAIWGVTDSLLLENMPSLANRQSLTGTHPYPDKQFWQQVTEDETVYNRYAHILLSPNQNESLRLVQADFFVARITCENVVGKAVTHLLSTSVIELPCFELKDTASVLGATVYFYQKKL